MSVRAEGPAARAASPVEPAWTPAAGDTGTQHLVQHVLALPLSTCRAPRRRERRRTGPCTVSFRLVAARAQARPVAAPTWLRVVRASAQVAALRADAARTVLEVAAVLALAARADATSAPTWPVLVERSGYSRATVARVLAWLRRAQLLVTLENGSTEQFRPRPRVRASRPAPVPVEGNRAAVYLLTEPLPDLDDVDLVDHAPDQSGHKPLPQTSSQVSTHTFRHETPRGFSRNPLGDQPREGARVAREERAPGVGAGSRAALRSGGRPSGDHLAASGLTRAPMGVSSSPARTGSPPDSRLETPPAGGGYRRGPRGTKGAQRAADLAVAAALRARSLDLRPLSDQAIRSAIRPHVARGYDVEDLLWSIDHEPSGAARTFTAGPRAGASSALALPAEVVGERSRRGVVADGGVRPAREVADPAGWLRWRLAPWAGRPAPVAARRAEALQRAARARQAAQERRAAHAAAVAAAVPPPAVLAEARAALRSRLGAQWPSAVRAPDALGLHTTASS